MERGQFLSVLSSEVANIVQLLKLSDPEVRYRVDLINKTKGLIKSAIPGCAVEVYGSWATQLALPSSDIDFVVLGCSQHPKDSVLRQIVAAFEQIGMGCTAVLTARVPVVKFHCSTTGLRGDITFNVNNWHTSVSLITDLLSKYSEYHARELIILFKFILVLTSNSEVRKGGLSSYGLSLMVFAFLRRFKEEGNQPSLGALLFGFLSHYRKGGTFDPAAMTVDIDKPEGFRKGLMRPMSSRQSEGSWCVQDPLTSGNNVTEQGFSINKISEIFTAMSSALERAMDSPTMPKSAGGQDCGILREAVRDLHHFQRQRRELLDLWKKQEIYQVHMQMVAYKGYHPWGQAYPTQHFHHHHHHHHHHHPHLYPQFFRSAFPGRAVPHARGMPGPPVSAFPGRPQVFSGHQHPGGYEQQTQKALASARTPDSSDEGSIDSCGLTESNSNSSGSGHRTKRKAVKPQQVRGNHGGKHRQL